MRYLLIFAAVLAVVVFTFMGVLYWRYLQLFPEPSTEVVHLTTEKRAHLQLLEKETKFGAHSFPPLGYTGAETPEDRERATAAVNGVMEALLAQPDGPVKAGTVSSLIGKAMRQVFWLATEDRDRTGSYMLEIWYILGFKLATGQFAYGPAYPKPDGYGEPLPPGWMTPD